MSEELPQPLDWDDLDGDITLHTAARRSPKNVPVIPDVLPPNHDQARDRQVVKPTGTTGTGEAEYRPAKEIALDDKARRHTIGFSKIAGADTMRVSGVGAIGAESIEVVKKFTPEELLFGSEDYVD